MKKLLSLLGVGVLVAMWSGCGVTNPASSVTIKIEGIGSVVAGGAAGQVTGTIETDSLLTNVNMKVLKGSTDVSSSFTVSFTSAYQNKKSADLKTDMSTTITAKSGTAADTYTLSITAEAGSITSTSTKDFTVTSTGTPVTTSQPIVMGSYKNATLGSSIDLDNGTVMLSAAAKAANSGVDLVGTVSDAAAMRIFTPGYAASGSGITAFANWNSPANTSIVQVPSSTTFDAITTAEQIESLYTAGTSADAFTATVGDVFVVKTDQNKYVAVEITAHEADNTGTFTLKYAK